MTRGPARRAVAKPAQQPALQPTLQPARQPATAAAAIDRSRLQGLKPAQADSLRRAAALVAAGDPLMAGQLLLDLARQLPGHPEVLRLQGLRHAQLGDWAAARASLQEAVVGRPGDLQTQVLLAQAQDLDGDAPAALQTLQQALQQASTDAAGWQALSLEADRQGENAIALTAIEQALALSPHNAQALLQRSRCLKALGQAEASAQACRRLIARGQETARAWFSLVDLKTVPLGSDELAALQQAAAIKGTPAADQMLLDFALGKALEDAGQHAAALAALHRANRAAHATKPWDARAFDRHAAAVRQAFAATPADPPTGQGHEVIFLVGLPRSGTTLVEQVLAAHSQVEGASELPYLQPVIDGESRRRGLPFPAWVPKASADDWLRLGREYLAASARWRAGKPRSTDKLPENWLLAGAVRAMLPGARMVDCRRDPVETCWSCYKQLFGPGHVRFTYDFADLAAYWHAYDQTCRYWAQRDPAAFRAQSYEALVAAPEAQIRELLAFCDLPFEAACLHFHTAQRAIRTPSALQVRQPLRKTSTPAAGYGALLDELRQLLQPLQP